MSKINRITPSKNSTLNSIQKSFIVIGDNTKRAIQMEVETHTLMLEKRKIMFEAILRNKPSENTSFRYLISGFGGMIGSVISTVLYTMPPVHNLFEDSQYW